MSGFYGETFYFLIIELFQMPNSLFKEISNKIHFLIFLECEFFGMIPLSLKVVMMQQL